MWNTSDFPFAANTSALILALKYRVARRSAQEPASAQPLLYQHESMVRIRTHEAKINALVFLIFELWCHACVPGVVFWKHTVEKRFCFADFFEGLHALRRFKSLSEQWTATRSSFGCAPVKLTTTGYTQVRTLGTF